MLEGCCQSLEVQLDQEHLAFGAVVQHCQVKKRIVMKNTGDTLAKFKWNTTNFPPALSITPFRGQIHPGRKVVLEVTFAPVELNNDIRYEKLSCCVEGFSSPPSLTVTGSCIVAPTSKEVVNFVCPVRGSHTQTLQVCNPTQQKCCITPEIKGEQWSAAPSFFLEPLQNKAYEITYKPVTMTAEGTKNQGSVFFSFPDGTAMLHSLQGTAEPPKPEDTVVEKLPAKTNHTLLLPVHNWLSRQQRFHVLTEILKPDKPDPTVSIKGVNFIEVPALAKINYKLSSFIYREGQYDIKVTFHNMESGEYLFYLVSLEVTSPRVMSTKKLVTAVRQKTSTTIEMENPLVIASCLTTECKCHDIIVQPQHIVPGQSKYSLTVEYRPLHVGESTTRLTLSNKDLGSFHYDLILRALPPPAGRIVHFSTSLGSSQSQMVKFTNHCPVKTEYSCKTDCPDFTVDKSVIASPGLKDGSEICVEVSFEPHRQGSIRGQLLLFSEAGGEYVFPLHATCLPPKPQGPFSIKAGRTISIPFKNTFQEATAFYVQVDKPYFSVREVGTILSKKTQNILISFEAPPRESPELWSGKLIISAQQSEGDSKPYCWTYYLKGVPP
ncbi:hydrocephalus-inducing protein-like [Antennarius striatus]|uniref:hydrocephalus-inducing protein-like n=1 Tax=Antennarius striatus TaxID=241820 RepID=UPI0035B0451B